MAPVTEIAYLTLKPGVELEGESPSAQAWADTITTIQGRDGYQKLYYGRAAERPDLLMLLIDWDAIDYHHAFIKSPQYGPFGDKLRTIITHVHLHHITPTPFPPSVLGSAPIVEFATFYKIEPGFNDNMKKFVEACLGAGFGGLLGGAYGESVEETTLHSEQLEGKEGNGKAMVLLVGWKSIESHMEFRETGTFKENLHLIREKTEGSELFHVPFKTV